MKKILIIVGVLLGLGLSGAATFFVTNYFHNRETEQLRPFWLQVGSTAEGVRRRSSVRIYQ